jgi:predicted nuclease with TOPRIM domain
MAGWKELLLDTSKLTDEVKRLNRDIERLDQHVVDVDKRMVRLETMVELAQHQRLPQIE